MIRLLRVIAVMVMLAGGVLRSSVQSLPPASSSRGVMEEATQLNEVVGKLNGEGKYREAVAPAGREPRDRRDRHDTMTELHMSRRL